MDTSTSKSIDTLVDDIYTLFDRGVEIQQELADSLGQAIATMIKSRLASSGEQRVPYLRMSNIGQPDRKLWYEFHHKEVPEALEPHTKLKFLYGDILEILLLFLARVSGHTVLDEQRQVEVDGVTGSIDATVDGVLVDVKSASSYAITKFKDGLTDSNDTFGYLDQLAGYSTGLGGIDGAFLAIDKANGTLVLDRHSSEQLQRKVSNERIKHLKEVVLREVPPERCFEPIPEGKSGNMALAIGCSYCPYKQECWSDANNGEGLRTFIYSTGPKFLVHVEKQPQVFEIKKENHN